MAHNTNKCRFGCCGDSFVVVVVACLRVVDVVFVVVEENPSICFNNSFLIRRVVSSSLELRLRQILSISSMNMMARSTLRAWANNSLINFSLSPNHDDRRSELESEKNVQLASADTACAIVDFPVPNNKIDVLEIIFFFHSVPSR